jgi:hypothetical protein
MYHLRCSNLLINDIISPPRDVKGFFKLVNQKVAFLGRFTCYNFCRQSYGNTFRVKSLLSFGGCSGSKFLGSPFKVQRLGSSNPKPRTVNPMREPLSLRRGQGWQPEQLLSYFLPLVLHLLPACHMSLDPKICSVSSDSDFSADTTQHNYGTVTLAKSEF